MRCEYCRPQWLTHANRRGDLTAAEIERLVRHLVTYHGVRKVRLTGGDPTARPDLVRIIRSVASIDGVEDLAMTTNGLSLAARAHEYADAGLGRLNVSLDALNADVFHKMTGVDGLHRVIDGLGAAESAGLGPIKLNTVVLRGRNDHMLPGLMRFAVGRGMTLRFIELMPMGPLVDQWAERYVPEGEMRRVLEPHVRRWIPLEQGSASARCYHVELDDGRTGVIGFISPMSCNFCAACSRLRIAADGSIYPCLMDRPAGSLMSAMRPRFDGAMLDRLLAEALAHKRAEHPTMGFVTMSRIGG
jgi:cyclic pyranopterin phosphate synthase